MFFINQSFVLWTVAEIFQLQSLKLEIVFYGFRKLLTFYNENVIKHQQKL